MNEGKEPIGVGRRARCQRAWWEQVVARLEASGIGAAAFAQREGIGYAPLRRWRTRPKGGSAAGPRGAGLSPPGSRAWPVHASWLNQIEIYFSIVQRKAPRPNDFTCLAALAERLSNFERDYESIAQPFEWKFSRADLDALMGRMRSRYAQTQQHRVAA